jgi:hypothetical protein
MPDSFLILTPLLVLAVVLLLGFAGCSFNVFIPGVEEPPPLIFRARVPTGLTALGGVSFRWLTPIGTMEEVATETSFAPEGTDNVYERKVPSVAGLWHVSCEMVAQDGGNQEPKKSPVRDFSLPADSQTHVYLFQAKGIPLLSFEIVPVGLDPP